MSLSKYLKLIICDREILKDGNNLCQKTIALQLQVGQNKVDFDTIEPSKNNYPLIFPYPFLFRTTVLVWGILNVWSFGFLV